MASGPVQPDLNRPSQAAAVRAVLSRMPPLRGEPIRLHHSAGLQDRRGPVHAGAFLRERRITFDCTRAELPRIFAHEIAHFIWLRLGNPARLSYEALLGGERAARSRGELGWSAEWRKRALDPRDVRERTLRWREYCCESFCDTAAWLYSGVPAHPEFTLAQSLRGRRARWFERTLGGGPLSI
jgi:hypothetical protein